jgi:hyaluronan synthase
MVIPVTLIGGAGWALHRASGSYLWLVPLGFVLGQVCLSWSQQAVTVTGRQAEQLARLYVTVIIPSYNEDPAILDRTIYALMVQTRQPDRVVVVDDGSTVNYDEVRYWWTAHSPVEFSWIRQDNAGKKHAQYAGFIASPEADIFVTIDSDSALAVNALEEGLKPFADPKVMSVAGLETAYNLNKNVLTRMQAMRTMVFQLFAMSAQSVAGGATLINPGAFSLYRGHLIRQVADAYIGETFFGIPIRIGDDTMLTLFALCAGKAVHQPTAAAFNVYPETLSHHLRQWIRWMRASTIRTMWRLRYLPLRNYSWWFSVYQLWAYITSIAVTVYIVAEWPWSAHLVKAGALALALWPLAVSIRLVTISRSDMRWLDWVKGLLLLPVGALWYTLVLRQMRIYGAFTCDQQGWVTRDKVEVFGQ